MIKGCDYPDDSYFGCDCEEPCDECDCDTPETEDEKTERYYREGNEPLTDNERWINAQ